MNKLARIENLWFEFYNLPFPAGMAGEDVKGICVTTLDTFTAGCISSFITQKGVLNTEKKRILVKCRIDLKTVVESLDGEAKKYFEKLLILTSEILND